MREVSNVVLDLFVLRFPYVPRDAGASVQIEIQLAGPEMCTYIDYIVHDFGVETIERRVQQETDEDDGFFSLEIKLYNVSDDWTQKIRDHVRSALRVIGEEYGCVPSAGFFEFWINGISYKDDAVVCTTMT